MGEPNGNEHLATGNEIRPRRRAAILSLVVSVLLFGIKFAAYKRTGSHAILSDALESIVNILTAFLALTVIGWANQPADEDHPYGHGKAEYFSAAFEGGLISFAGLMILVQAGEALFDGPEIRRLDQGLWLIAAAGVINYFLGRYLLRVGHKGGSAALIASGHHVLSDVWTSCGVILGLLLVYWTGWLLLDPLIALAVGVQLSWTGIHLVRKAAGGLLDQEDPGVIERLSELFTKHAFPGIIRIHYTRVIRSGDRHHVDAHVVLPEFWSVQEAHGQTNRFEERVLDEYGRSGEIMFHFDPCRQAYCKICDLPECPIRRVPFEKRVPFSPDELRSTVEADEIQK